jgi:two-component system LytT family response regulator
VNLNQIREIYREGSFDGSIVLTNGKTLRMSKAGRQKLNEISRIPR